PTRAPPRRRPSRTAQRSPVGTPAAQQTLRGCLLSSSYRSWTPPRRSTSSSRQHQANGTQSIHLSYCLLPAILTPSIPQSDRIAYVHIDLVLVVSEAGVLRILFSCVLELLVVGALVYFVTSWFLRRCYLMRGMVL